MNRETGLFFYFSNDLNHLFESISNNLKRLSPFQKKWILVPSGVARNHLKQKICDDLGICMGVDFYSLQAGIHRILNMLYPQIIVPTHLELALQLQQLIEENLGKDHAFDKVYDYIGVSKNSSYFKSLAYLTDQLAALFVQYSLYCPDLKNQWISLIDKEWQQKLWEKSLDQSSYYHNPAQILQLEAAPIDEPVTIYIVGYSYLPTPYLQLLKKAAEVFQIQFYRISPCAYFWSETKTDKERTGYLSYLKKKGIKDNQLETLDNYLLEQNPLLTHFGSIGRETLKIIEEDQSPIEEKYFIPQEGFNHPFYSDWITDSFSQNSQPLTLLKSLQLDLLVMRTDKNKINCKKDDSLKIVQVSTYEREIEVLYHYLLNLFDKDDQLKPSQVVVYLTNIQNYIPYIHNVFLSEGHNLDYFIYNAPFSLNNLVLNALFLILDLAGSRWDKEKIISLLTLPAFKERFQLSEDVVKKWGDWINEVGVGWGIDGQDQTEKLKISYEQVMSSDQIIAPNWQDFIESILKFMSAQKKRSALHQHLSRIDFSDSDTLGQFIDIFTSLKNDLKILGDPNRNNFQKWSLYIKCLLESYFQFDIEQENELLRVYQVLDALSEGSQKLEDYEVSFETFYHYLKKQLIDHPAKIQGFQKESISFYSLQDNTPISAKVVCLLGLNDEVFPKNVENPLSVIKEFPQSSFIPRSSDHARYLFLEILISTSQNLLLSYVGDCKKTFKSLMPSPLLIELQNYLDDYFLIDGQTPSQMLFELNSHLSFEASYFKQKHFSQRHHKLAKSYYQKRKNLEENFRSQLIENKVAIPLKAKSFSLNMIDIKDLLSVAKDPIQYFLKNSHHIHLDPVESYHENQNFSLTAYQKAILKKETFIHQEHLEQEGLPKGMFRKVMMGILQEEKEQVEFFLIENEIEKEKFLTIELRADVESPFLLKENYWMVPCLKIGCEEVGGIIEQVSSKGLILNQKDNLEGIIKEWPKILIYQHLTKILPQLECKALIFLKSQKIVPLSLGNETEILAQFLEYSRLCQDSLVPLLPSWTEHFLEKDAQVIQEKIAADLKSAHFYHEYARALFDEQLPSLEQIESWKDLAKIYFSKMDQELLK